MKFDARTIQILRNFSSINPSIIFKPGNEIKTISVSRSIMARAKIGTDIGSIFAIYDLGKFLSAVTFFDSPDLITEEGFMVIKSGSEKFDYVFSDPRHVLAAPEKELPVPDGEVNFVLKSDVLSRLQKALGIIGAPEIAFTGDGEKIYLEAIHSKDSTNSAYRVEVGETDKTFRFIFMAENVKILSGDYNVTASKGGVAHFKADDIEYWIAMESNSSYNS